MSASRSSPVRWSMRTEKSPPPQTPDRVHHAQQGPGDAPGADPGNEPGDEQHGAAHDGGEVAHPPEQGGQGPGHLVRELGHYALGRDEQKTDGVVGGIGPHAGLALVGQVLDAAGLLPHGRDQPLEPGSVVGLEIFQLDAAHPVVVALPRIGLLGQDHQPGGRVGVRTRAQRHEGQDVVAPAGLEVRVAEHVRDGHVDGGRADDPPFPVPDGAGHGGHGPVRGRVQDRRGPDATVVRVVGALVPLLLAVGRTSWASRRGRGRSCTRRNPGPRSSSTARSPAHRKWPCRVGSRWCSCLS